MLFLRQIRKESASPSLVSLLQQHRLLNYNKSFMRVINNFFRALIYVRDMTKCIRITNSTIMRTSLNGFKKACAPLND